MQFKHLDEIDLKLHLQSGSEIRVDNLEIEPYTLKEIKNYGYNNYMKNLQWLEVTVDDLIKSFLDIEKRMELEVQKSKLKVFDFYIKLGGQELFENLIFILAMIFKTKDIIRLDEKTLAIDFVKKGIFVEDEDGKLSVDAERLASLSEDEIKVVHRDNFDEIVEVVKYQNYLNNVKDKKKEQDANPADEETRKLMEEMERQRQRVEAKKKAQQLAEKGDESIDITDIISAVTAKSNCISKLNVWEHTLYQLYDEYSRLELIDNYDFSIRAMMAGAEKIDLKHWSSKL